MNDFSIRPLTPALRDDYLNFFDHAAFIDNPNWAGCYCQFYLTDPTQTPWDERAAIQNRQSAARRIASGEMQGYLAYLGEKVVGWCHAAPRLMLPLLASEPELDSPDADQVGSIVCFIVAPPYRNQGVARALLEAAVAGFRERGLQWAEGYPRVGRSDAAANYHGPLVMFQQGGFQTIKAYPTYQIVRKELI